MKLITIAAFLAATFQVNAQDGCGVRVIVRTEAGDPVKLGTAYLLDALGVPVLAVPISNGNAEFCDFDFGIHEIVIPIPGCGQSVSLKGVRLDIWNEQRFSVILNGCGGDSIVVPSSCLIYARVSSSVKALPLPGVDITVKNNEASWTARTDRYGRARLAVRAGTIGVATFSKVGFENHEEQLTCSSSLEGRREVSVRLVPR